MNKVDSMRPKGASSVKETVEPQAGRQAASSLPTSPPQRVEAQTVRRMQMLEDRVKQLEFRFAALLEDLHDGEQEVP